MPNIYKYKKNKISRPKHVDCDIVDRNDGVVGKIRVKPSTILWKPKSAHQFFPISLEAFSTWITNNKTGAVKTTR